MTETITPSQFRRGNIAIAKFIGYEYIDRYQSENRKQIAGWWKVYITTQNIIPYLGRNHNELMFNHNWKRLMFALDIVEKYGETDKTYGTYISINTSNSKVGKSIIDLKLEPYKNLTKIEATWLALVKHIETETNTEILKDTNINQCDGCNAGYPVDENGLHIVEYPSGSMVCQKQKYNQPL